MYILAFIKMLVVLKFSQVRHQADGDVMALKASEVN